MKEATIKKVEITLIVVQWTIFLCNILKQGTDLGWLLANILISWSILKRDINFNPYYR